MKGAAAGATATASVSGLEDPRPVEGGAVEAKGVYSFELTFDPGDGTRTSSQTVAVTCRAATSPAEDPPQDPTPAQPVPGNPAYTG